MKKSFILGFIAALAFSACSNEELTADGGANGNGGGQKFLSVSIVSTASSRAAGDQVPGDPDGNATYEEGTELENKVTSVRFFFFKENGDAAKVLAADADINYSDWTPTGGEPAMPNVEKSLDATLVISTERNDQVPAKIVAVLNPTSTFITATNKKATSLASLKNTMKNYAGWANGTESTDRVFVMYNSVYANAGSAVEATDIPVTAFQASEELAKANPVNIYVERTVAKVRVRLSESTEEKEQVTFAKLKDGNEEVEVIVLKSKEGDIIKVDDKQVYLRLSGWNLTADRKNTYLGKHIDATWASNLFGATEKWNWSAYFRSYWAINTNLTGTVKETQNYYSYEDLKNGGKSYKNGYYYTNENTPHEKADQSMLSGASVEKFTKVIMTGELVCQDKDEQGNDIVAPITLCKYAGLTVAGTPNLKAALLKQLESNGMIYSVDNDDDGDVTTTTFTTLTADDVTFMTALENDANVTNVDDSEKTQGRYYVYLVLSEEGEGKTWTFDNDPYTENRKTLTTDEVNSYFYNQIGQCSVYRGGRTYYFFPIRHLGASGEVGYYGVVRNHIYDCNVTKIAGLGTPVYNPSQTIWPETTIDEDTYIAAKINILSWRVVPNDYTLEW